MSLLGALGWRGLPVAASLAVALSPFPRDSNATTQSTGPPASISIASPVQDDAVAGSVVVVRLSAAPPKNVYVYVTVDRAPPANGSRFDAATFRSASATVSVAFSNGGTHRIFAVFGDAGRLRTGSAIDDVSVSVAGPFLKATGPRTAIEGEPWTIKVSPPASHPLAKTGKGNRLVFAVDGELPPLRRPVASDAEGVVITNVTSVPFTGLEAGDHGVWVVLIGPNDAPLEPYLAAFVPVTINA